MGPESGASVTGPAGLLGEEVTSTIADVPVRPARGEGPQRIGRYLTLRRLGEGAMGEVYLGYDEPLDRRVAIKIVRSMGQRTDEVYARMLREAQGLARLSHPNVVQVYEAGEVEGRVYLAMEYVEGVTLRVWGATPRSWAEAQTPLLEAGRGLAAAHAAGLVHRDFKPENVMVGADGRTRVMDFGLVRAGSEAAGEVRSPNLRQSSPASELTSELTAAHTLIGTPAYMSPEQHLRQVADARSDVFAYCVVVYELLCGARPFAGKDQGSVMRAVLEQSLTPPLPGRRVPPHVRRALLRGLSLDPSARWQTMEELLAALRRDPREVWRRRLVAGTAVLGLVGGAAWAGWRERSACAGGEAALAGAWDEGVREAVRSGLTATGVTYAGEAAGRALARLDEYAAEWLTMRRSACLDHRSGANSGELLDLRMACLEQRRQELAALAQVLAGADAPVVERVGAAVGDLPRISACGEIEYLKARLRPPEAPEAARAVEGLRGALAEVRALERAARYEDARVRLAAAREAAAAVEYPPIVVELEVARGRLELARGDAKAAAATLEAAYYEARGLGHDAAAIVAAISLMSAQAGGLGDFAAAERWLPLAAAEVRHAGTKEQEGDLAFVTGGMRSGRGDYVGAIAELEVALRKRREALGEVHPAVIEVLTALGVSHFKLSHPTEAARHFEAARRLAEVVLGPDHPTTASVLSRHGMLLSRERRFDEAAPMLARALKIFEGALGPRHARVIEALLALGELEIRRHAYTTAIAYVEGALAAAEAAGPEHPLLPGILGTLAGARYKRGDDPAAALALQERAVAASTARFGEAHPYTAILRSNLGEFFNDAGRFAEAKAMIGPSLAALDAAMGAERPDSGPIHRELARALLGVGEAREAEAEARRALELYARAPEAQPEEMAAIHFVLARAQVAVGGDVEAARAAAQEAEAALRRLGTEPRRVAEIEAWLASVPPG